MSTKSSCELTEERISSLNNLIDAILLLEDIGIEEDVKDLHTAKILLRQCLEKDNGPLNEPICNFNYSRNKDIVKILIHLYELVISKISDEKYKPFLDDLYPLYQSVKVEDHFGQQKELTSLTEYLEFNKERVSDEECPIIVTGTVSSGKSSFINMIIGENIMPSHTSHMTTTACILYSESIKRVVATPKLPDHDKLERCFNETHNADDVNLYLKILMQSGIQYLQIEVYWPVKHLPRTIPIIDTPALNLIGSVQQISKAAAIICIFNSSLAESIYNEIPNFFAVDGVKSALSFMLKPPLFIFNKWDTVPINSHEHYRCEAKKRMSHFMLQVFPQIAWNSNWLQEHIFELSIEKIQDQLQAKINPENIETYDYKKFIGRFQQFLSDALDNQCIKSLRLLQDVVQEINIRLRRRIYSSCCTAQKKEALIKKDDDAIKFLKENLPSLEKKLSEYLRKKHHEILLKLQNSIHSQQAHKEMEEWCTYNIVQGDSYDVIKHTSLHSIDEMILSRLSKQKHIIFNYLIHKIEEKVNSKFESIIPETGIPLSTGVQPHAVSKAFHHWFYSTLKDIISEAKKQWKSNVKNFDPLKKYKQDKLGRMKKWLSKRLQKKWSLKSLEQMQIVDTLLHEVIVLKVQALTNERIPATIESIKYEQRYKLDSLSTNDSCIKDLLHVQEDFKLIFGEMKYISLSYFNDDSKFIPFDNLEIINGESNTYFRGKLSKTINVMSRLFKFCDGDKTIYLQLSDIDTLRSIEHINVVQLLGVTIDESGSSLYTLEDIYSANLEDIYFARREFVPSFHKLQSKARQTSFVTYKDFVVQIQQGLDFIHSKGCIHRNLKLSNIFVTGYHVKIGALGSWSVWDLQSSDFLQNTRHFAPEVSKKGIYTCSSDVFSFAVVLLEMWTGRQHKPNHNNSLEDKCRDGDDEFAEQHSQLPWCLKVLTQLILTKDEHQRPAISDITDQLKLMHDTLFAEFVSTKLKKFYENVLLMINDRDTCHCLDDVFPSSRLGNLITGLESTVKSLPDLIKHCSNLIDLDWPIIITGNNGRDRRKLLNKIIGENIIPQDEVYNGEPIVKVISSPSLKMVEIHSGNIQKMNLCSPSSEMKKAVYDMTISSLSPRQIDVYWPIPHLATFNPLISVSPKELSRCIIQRRNGLFLVCVFSPHEPETILVDICKFFETVNVKFILSAMSELPVFVVHENSAQGQSSNIEAYQLLENYATQVFPSLKANISGAKYIFQVDINQVPTPDSQIINEDELKFKSNFIDAIFNVQMRIFADLLRLSLNILQDGIDGLTNKSHPRIQTPFNLELSQKEAKKYVDDKIMEFKNRIIKADCLRNFHSSLSQMLNWCVINAPGGNIYDAETAAKEKIRDMISSHINFTISKHHTELLAAFDDYILGYLSTVSTDASSFVRFSRDYERIGFLKRSIFHSIIKNEKKVHIEIDGTIFRSKEMRYCDDEVILMKDWFSEISIKLTSNDSSKIYHKNFNDLFIKVIEKRRNLYYEILLLPSSKDELCRKQETLHKSVETKCFIKAIECLKLVLGKIQFYNFLYFKYYSGNIYGQSMSHSATTGVYCGQSTSHSATTGVYCGQSTSHSAATTGMYCGQSMARSAATTGMYCGQSMARSAATTGVYYGKSMTRSAATTGMYCGDVIENQLGVKLEFIPFSKQRYKVFLHLSEFENNRRINHENILKFYGVYIRLPSVYFVSELTVMNMEKYLSQNQDLVVSNHDASCKKRQEAWSTYKNFVSQIIAGLLYLHKNIRRSHRNIKLDNIFITDKKIIKLGRFGAALIYELTHGGSLPGDCSHIDPRVFNSWIYSISDDIYALSNVFLMMWIGANESNRENICENCLMPQDTKMPNKLNGLLMRMKCDQAHSRPDIVAVSEEMNNLDVSEQDSMSSSIEDHFTVIDLNAFEQENTSSMADGKSTMNDVSTSEHEKTSSITDDKSTMIDVNDSERENTYLILEDKFLRNDEYVREQENMSSLIDDRFTFIDEDEQENTSSVTDRKSTTIDVMTPSNTSLILEEQD